MSKALLEFEMPKNCGDCDLKEWQNPDYGNKCYCLANITSEQELEVQNYCGNERHPQCPLKRKPQLGDDVEEALKRMETVLNIDLDNAYTLSLDMKPPFLKDINTVKQKLYEQDKKIQTQVSEIERLKEDFDRLMVSCSRLEREKQALTKENEELKRENKRWLELKKYH